MDKITLQRIETFHPIDRDNLRKAYIKANNVLGKNVRLRFALVFRTPQQQAELFKKRPKVTNADAWQSIHNYGLAFDIVLLYDNDGNGTFEEASWNTKRDGDKDGIADWLEVTRVFEKAGFKNGFISNGKKWDLPHFQKDFGFKPRQLKALIDSGKTIVDNGIIYPKI